jgi:hypothetical protein
MATFNFSMTSRYYNAETAAMETDDGRIVTYLRRRFLPAPEKFSTIDEHVVSDGERLDTISARYQGDPEAFWRIADANRAMRPQELTETLGRRLRITLPEGVPGLPNA